MVNLEKWEQVEHEDVKVGDKLKIVTTIKGVNPALTVEINKGKVWHVDPYSHDIYLSDGSEWETDDPDEGETCTVYRRKVVEKGLDSHKYGTVIKGQRKGYPDIFIHFTKAFYGGWTHQSGTEYSTEDVERSFENFEVLSKGVKSKSSK